MQGHERYLALFVDEARDLLAALSEALHALEGGEATVLPTLFRAAHSVKGMAGSVGLCQIEVLSHALEDAFDSLRRGEGPAGGELMETFWRGSEALASAVEAVAAGGQEPTLEPLAEAIRSHAARDAGDSPSSAPVPAALPPKTEPTAAREAYEGPVLEVTLHLQGCEMPMARAAVLRRRLWNLGRVLEDSSEQEEGGDSVGSVRVRARVATCRPAARVAAWLRGLEGVGRVEVRLAEPEGADGGGSLRGGGIRLQVEEMDLLLEEATEVLLHQARLERMMPAGVAPEVAYVLERLRGTANRLIARLVEARMLPFRAVVPSLERATADLARRLGKMASLEIEGDEVRMDRSMLEKLMDPLTHLLRNALDHGIEMPAERSAAGKPARGMLRIRLHRASDTVVLTVEDDGRGMDPDLLRRKAVEAGALDEERARSLSDQDALLLATLPGLSTSRATTEVSGRGVGLDAVRDRVEALGGNLHFGSRRGAGTQVVLRMPPAAVVLSSFLVRAEGELFAVPVRSVEETVRLRDAERSPAAPRLETADAFALCSALRGERKAPATEGVALLYTRRGRLLAAVVDEVIGRRDLVVRPLFGPLEAMGEASGAAVLGDGSVVPVLDLENVGPPAARVRRSA